MSSIEKPPAFASLIYEASSGGTGVDAMGVGEEVAIGFVSTAIVLVGVPSTLPFVDNEMLAVLNGDVCVDWNGADVVCGFSTVGDEIMFFETWEIGRLATLEGFTVF